MATFNYQALTNDGKSINGALDADSPKMVRQQLREKGLIIVSVNLAKASDRRAARIKVNHGELVLATRQLSTLVAAALPLEEALKAVSQQTNSKVLKTLFSQVREKVLEGHTLADALAEFPRTFDHLFRAMIAAGEASGHLALVLNRLAEHLERSHAMKSKLTQAMVYPIVLTVIAIGVVTILLAAVVPKVVEQFIRMKQTLPFTTQALIVISDFIRHQGVWILLAIVLAAIVMKLWLRSPDHRLRFHQVILSIPVVGNISRELNTARYARTLSILNSSAVPLLDAMRISASVLSNNYAKEKLIFATERVRQGVGLHLALAESKLFSPMMMHMIASGEKSGELDSMLERAADMQDNALNSQITIAMSLFEPLLVISMASVVLFIILAILQPILQLNNMVG